jgi:hypothetical protein
MDFAPSQLRPVKRSISMQGIGTIVAHLVEQVDHEGDCWAIAAVRLPSYFRKVILNYLAVTQ